MDTPQTRKAASGATRPSPALDAPTLCARQESRERIRELLGWNMLPTEEKVRPYAAAC